MLTSFRADTASTTHEHVRSKRSCGGLWPALTASILLISTAQAADLDAGFAGTNDYGDVGLLQTPTARVRPEGEFGAGVSFARPYTDVHFFLQFLPWLETTFRYIHDTEVPYGVASFSGDQHLSDKSFDLKAQVLPESRYFPAIAVGLQDFIGTGDFASQYVVANYHLYSLDFSAGLGWGRLGTSGRIYNPFRIFGHHFDRERNASVGQGGNFEFHSLFIGHDVAPFGGLRWNTPVKNLSILAEYDSNNYTQEPGFGGPIKLKQNSHVNAGISYELIPGVNVGVGYERGNTVMARIDLSTNFETFLGVSKKYDPSVPSVPEPATSAPRSTAQQELSSVSASEPLSTSTTGNIPEPKFAGLHSVAASSASASELLFNQVSANLKGQGLILRTMRFDPPFEEITVWVANEKYRSNAEVIGRTARSLVNVLPASVARITVVPVEFGAEDYRVVLSRSTLIEAASRSADAAQLGAAVALPAVHDGMLAGQQFAPAHLGLDWDMGPSVRQYIDSPNGFYFGQLWWRMETDLKVSDHLSFTGVGGLNVYNNFYGLNQTSNSLLPHVRSDIVQYLKGGKNNLVELEGDYIWSPANHWWARISAGIFEPMYAGVAAEVLYRPFDKPWAIGIDINHVRQRSYNQLLDFRPYQTTEAFLTLYYRLPFYHLLAQITGGRYLAGDKGGTIDISRQFASGVVAGVFVTKTNVSAAQFGEGSFDKGLYLSVPFDFFVGESTKESATFAYRPLTRDGGQRATDGTSLYGATSDDLRTLNDEIGAAK